jgi:hypothetical protein
VISVGSGVDTRSTPELRMGESHALAKIVLATGKSFTVFIDTKWLGPIIGYVRGATRVCLLLS